MVPVVGLICILLSIDPMNKVGLLKIKVMKGNQYDLLN